jgi:hypothetical protein
MLGICAGFFTGWMAVGTAEWPINPQGCYQTKAECRAAAISYIDRMEPGKRSQWSCIHLEFQRPTNKTAEDLELK